MRVYKTKQVAKWSKEAGVSDAQLCEAARDLGNGIFDADLGEWVYKLRVQRPGTGRSRGGRVIVGYSRGDRMLFVFGFSKSLASTLTKDGERALKLAAASFLDATDEAVRKLVGSGKIMEVNCDAQARQAPGAAP